MSDVRVPGGRPTGGQFAAHDRADADVTLGRSGALRRIDAIVHREFPEAAYVAFEDYTEGGGIGLSPTGLENADGVQIIEFDGATMTARERAVFDALAAELVDFNVDDDGVGASSIELHYPHH